MITSNSCWLKNECKKYNNLSKECECRTTDVFCIKLFKLDELYNNALLDINQRKRKNLVLDADKCDFEAFDRLKGFCDFIEQFVDEGRNLYIYSTITGNGKTAWAERFCQCYINSIWYKSDLECKVLFINVPRFLISMKENITNSNEYFSHIRDNILKANLVIWDDIATKDTTQFEHENLLSMIDSRVSIKKSNIFTSNIPPNELEKLMGPRLASRIIGYSECIQFKGKDKRGSVI